MPLRRSGRQGGTLIEHLKNVLFGLSLMAGVVACGGVIVAILVFFGPTVLVVGFALAIAWALGVLLRDAW